MKTSSSFHQNKYKSRHTDVKFTPSKNDGRLVHFINALKYPRLEFVQGFDSDVAQERARHF